MLDAAQLARVACGAPRGDDLFVRLAPLRALRPANGGPGHSAEALAQLRALHLQFQ